MLKLNLWAAAQTVCDRRIVKYAGRNKGLQLDNSLAQLSEKIEKFSGPYSKNPMKKIAAWIKQYKTNLELKKFIGEPFADKVNENFSKLREDFFKTKLTK